MASQAVSARFATLIEWVYVPGRLGEHPLEDRRVQVGELHELEPGGALRVSSKMGRNPKGEDAAEEPVGHTPTTRRTTMRGCNCPGARGPGNHQGIGEREQQSGATRSIRFSASSTTAVAGDSAEKREQERLDSTPVPASREARDRQREKDPDGCGNEDRDEHRNGPRGKRDG